MKNKNLLLIFLMLLWPAALQGGDQEKETNVNERYVVESVALSGVSESKISKTLREDLQKLVGEKYNQKAAHELAGKIRGELREYDVEVKVKRGDNPEHVKVVYRAERVRWKRFEVPIPLVVYHSKQGFSGTMNVTVDIHHNVFTFGLVSNADSLLERNAGLHLRYENRKVGTDMVQLRIDFDSTHQTFNAATESALAERPDVPGVYR